MTSLNTALLLFDFCILPLFGWIASQVNREKLMLGAAICTMATAIPLFMLFPVISFASIVAIRLYFVVLGVAFFAPFHAWAQQLIPASSRYTVLSLGYSLGTQLLGGPTAAISLWAFQQTGVISSVAWFWTFLALLSSLAIALLTNRRLSPLSRPL